MTRSLRIENLHVNREGKEIVRGVTIDVPAGEIHALMGPNGSGKSSLANAIMGHPKYSVAEGRVILDGEDITALPPNEKARRGLFLSMQHPPEIAGVTVSNFLRAAVNAAREKPLGVIEFQKTLRAAMAELQMDPSFGQRHLNEGFSGGEKKRAEILQLSLLKPKYAVLDETDSGLDVDALKIVTDGVNRARGTDMGILIITHYTHILRYLKPDKVHVLSAGRIVTTGGAELADDIEKNGYTKWLSV